MPPASNRCSYREGGLRCRKNGIGTPRLCREHRIVLEQAARDGARPAVVDVLRDFIAGRRVSTDRIFDAAYDLLRHPAAPRVAEEVRRRVAGGMPSARPGSAPPPPRMPPVDPKIERIKRHCQALGLDPATVTAEDVTRKRRELAKKHHPDLVPEGPERVRRTERMKVINAHADDLLDALG